MARIESMTNNLLDSILPVYGQPRENTPIWNESQHMFIINEYESAAGHRYYDGVRISNRIVIVEHIGLYHSFQYIDGIDMYLFDSNDKKLMGQKKYDKQFYNIEFIRQETKNMLSNYIRTQAAFRNTPITESVLENEVNQLINNSYQSLTSEESLARLAALRPIMNKALNK